jgi:streptogramin lyase
VQISVPDGGNVRIVTEGTSTVGQVQCQTGAVLQENGGNGRDFNRVVSVPAGAAVFLQGAFNKVDLLSPVNLQLTSVRLRN